MVGNKSNTAFYSLNKGKVVRTYKEPVPGLTKERLNAKQRIVHEAIYDYISGRIVDIQTREREGFDKEWNITLQDSEGNIEVLQFKFSCGYADGFLRALPNVDLNQEVQFIPNLKIVDGKDRTTMFLSQHGKSLKWYYTKDNPNGLPQWEEVKRKGKMEWDNSDQMEFLENMVKNEIVPKLPKSAVVSVAVPAGHENDAEDWPTTQQTAPAPTEGDGKMPF